ncbi:hypothetical protein [Bacillus cereus]|uniref:hypothetical protein n=1 Tax=Bacillus cereus TaxID=1396 RepID=UPI00398112C4
MDDIVWFLILVVMHSSLELMNISRYFVYIHPIRIFKYISRCHENKKKSPFVFTQREAEKGSDRFGL